LEAYGYYLLEGTSMSTVAIASIAAAGIGAAGSLAAGHTQAQASKNAAQLQSEEAANALAFQQQQYQTNQQNMAPFLQGGYGALGQLEQGLGIQPQTAGGVPLGTLGGGAPNQQYSALPGQATVPVGRGTLASPGGPGSALNARPGQATAPTSALARAPGTEGGVNPVTGQPLAGVGGAASGIAPGSLIAPFSQQFQAPTLQQAEQYPGYQFQLQQGQRAIQNSAAAKGGLVSGGTAEALNNYAQGSAQSDYQNVYNQAMQEYLNSYNIYNSNQANQYNRLASLAGLGQTATQQLGAQGQAAAGNVANISLGAGQQIGQSIQNRGAATASGYAGAANAFSSGLSNAAGAMYLNQLGGLAAPISGVPVSTGLADAPYS
jgi:hypothetical protein